MLAYLNLLARSYDLSNQRGLCPLYESVHGAKALQSRNSKPSRTLRGFLQVPSDLWVAGIIVNLVFSYVVLKE